MPMPVMATRRRLMRRRQQDALPGPAAPATRRQRRTRFGRFVPRAACCARRSPGQELRRQRDHREGEADSAMPGRVIARAEPGEARDVRSDDAVRIARDRDGAAVIAAGSGPAFAQTLEKRLARRSGRLGPGRADAAQRVRVAAAQQRERRRPPAPATVRLSRRRDRCEPAASSRFALRAPGPRRAARGSASSGTCPR